MFLCSGGGAAQPASEGVLRGNERKQGVWRGLSVRYMPFWPSRARVWFPAVAKVAQMAAFMPFSHSAHAHNTQLDKNHATEKKRVTRTDTSAARAASACCLHLPSGTIRTAACSLTSVRMPRDADSPTSRHLLHCR